MQINEAIRNLEIAGYMVVDENHHSLDNMARLIKETYGISAKVNQEKIYRNGLRKYNFLKCNLYK